MAVLPATTPERATDFLTLETEAGMGLESLMGKLFRRFVAEGLVEVGTGLHFSDDSFLRAVMADCVVDFERDSGGGAAGAERIKHHRDAGGAEFVERE